MVGNHVEEGERENSVVQVSQPSSELRFLVVHTIDGDVVQDRTEEVDSGSHEARVDEQHWDGVFFKLTGHWGSDSTFISEIDHQLEVQVNDVIHEVNQEVTVIDIDERNLSDESHHEAEDQQLGDIESWHECQLEYGDEESEGNGTHESDQEDDSEGFESIDGSVTWSSSTFNGKFDFESLNDWSVLVVNHLEGSSIVSESVCTNGCWSGAEQSVWSLDGDLGSGSWLIPWEYVAESHEVFKLINLILDSKVFSLGQSFNIVIEENISDLLIFSEDGVNRVWQRNGFSFTWNNSFRNDWSWVPLLFSSDFLVNEVVNWSKVLNNDIPNSFVVTLVRVLTGVETTVVALTVLVVRIGLVGDRIWIHTQGTLVLIWSETVLTVVVALVALKLVSNTVVAFWASTLESVVKLEEDTW